MMTKLKPAYVYLAVGVALILGWFYWYEYRPEQLRERCTEELLKWSDNETTNDWVRDWAGVCADAGGALNFNAAIEARKNLK